MKIIFILFFVTITIFSYGQNLNEGIVGYWSFENLDGGNNYKGKLTNSNLENADLNNKALMINGKGSYLQMNKGLDLFDHFTITFWINFSELNQEYSIINQVNSNGRFFKLKVDSKNFILSCSDEFNFQNTIFSNEHKMVVGKWYFVSIRAENANLTLQLNSTKLIQIDNLNLNIREKQFNDSLTIGVALSENNNMSSFHGFIDELVVYNRKISYVERDMLFSKKLPDPVPLLEKAPIINGRMTEVFASYKINESRIRIEYYDKDKVDNDRISLYFNGEVILEDEVLTKKKKEIWLDVEPYKNNYLTLFANNLGKYPPNTAYVVVYTNNRKHELSLKSDYEKNATLKFVYIPKND